MLILTYEKSPRIQFFIIKSNKSLILHSLFLKVDQFNNWAQNPNYKCMVTFVILKNAKYSIIAEILKPSYLGTQFGPT